MAKRGDLGGNDHSGQMFRLVPNPRKRNAQAEMIFTEPGAVRCWRCQGDSFYLIAETAGGGEGSPYTMFLCHTCSMPIAVVELHVPQMTETVAGKLRRMGLDVPEKLKVEPIQGDLDLSDLEG